MSDLLRHLETWKPSRILVVGDFMLDEHVYGAAERLSGDAPVPVLHVQRVEQIPGGAANVASDLVALRAHVRIFGVVGDDATGVTLRAKLGEAGIDAEGLITDAERPTTVKRNLVGLAQHRHPQKMFRLDEESKRPLSSEVRAQLLTAISEAITDADCVAIEDYAKGVCDERLCQAVIELARANGVPVLVDPAAITDYSLYRGCTAITPNRSEAEKATGLSGPSGAQPDPEWMAHDLLNRLGCEAVVLTLDREGALLLERGAAPLRVPTTARQVYDVTGAGDMVLAALGAARANHVPWPLAVQLANLAAGLEVEVFGVQPIPIEQLHQSAIAAELDPADKLRSLTNALVEVAATCQRGGAVVFTNGCFDLLHAGHVSLIRQAKTFGDLLIVAMNSDESIRRLKGADRPVHTQADRVTIVSELASVGIVLVFDDDTPEPLLEAIRPDVLVKGADYAVDQVVGREIVEKHGGRIELVDLLQGRSTTATIERIAAE